MLYSRHLLQSTTRGATASRVHQPANVLRAHFATARNSKAENSSTSSTIPGAQQEFVKTRFEPPDPECGDPEHPPWKSRVKLISAEDFEMRPRAGSNEEFESLHDARIVLSWLTKQDRDNIYQDYLNMMEEMRAKENVTSHDYIVRVIAQKYNMKIIRAAAIIELEHNEHRIRAEEPDRKLHYDVQAYVDKKIQEHIKAAYEEYDEISPGEFVEQPYTMLKDKTSKVTPISDIHNIDGLYEKTLVREREEAQHQLDTRRYIEDFDERTRNVSMSKDCERLVEKANEDTEMFGVDRYNDRWRYVAHIIDTKEEKKLLKARKQFKKSKRNGNTVVSHKGKVRPATISEEKEVAWGKWKVTHHSHEWAYRNAKSSWLEKITKGKTDAWGRCDPSPEDLIKTERRIDSDAPI
mmetsp:Transcript_14289/g.22014  ORF Transcript_14289/g.22014 Transcript_14289/m.22014 type:complete len:408 (+) Transcript_14289:99-1322(+)|eukprot:CAMPEP_0196811636 /NCGR_PEP_ID=MMETSP1362-20130617/19342_1 /TAXON_ID=163516 /ORGANISM="Leptocylindrus danicus, Strain CCMP1856" /LENGTH=407 /DNA_ID=CAMNT_0042186991 /DNA_START=99 /DNA_END=1322 /DNA_ORIENTATION=-